MNADGTTQIVDVCMICKRRVTFGNVPIGTPFLPTPGIVLSHSLCIECAPGYFRELGLSEADQRQIFETIRD